MGMNRMVGQQSAGNIRAQLKLIPPLADEFSLYGGGETVKRAQQWALDKHYLLAAGVATCAHGLYLMDICPTGLKCCPGFDHTQIWIPDNMEEERPFILTHPYHSEVDESFYAYASAHGLRVSSDHPTDGWYGTGSLPIRLTIPESWPFWPIEAEAGALLRALPVRWPDQG